MVAQLRPLFGTTGHKVKTQGITPSSGLKRRDIEITNYLSDSAGSRNLVIDLSITHDRHGSSLAQPHLNGTLSHPDSPDTPLNEAAKLNERLTNTATHTLTITASLSYPPSQAPPHAYTASSSAFSSSRPIGRLRTTSPSWVLESTQSVRVWTPRQCMG